MIHEVFYLRDQQEPDAPRMITYILDDPLERSRKRPVVIVCPGGGYSFCSPREAEPIALEFAVAGLHTVVVNYTVNARFPEALKDLSKAVCLVREHAEEWNIDPDQVYVCGFSAGGHLAASLGVFWNTEPAIRTADEKNKPNGLMLAYPVISSGPKAHPGSIQVLSGEDQALWEKMSLEKQVNPDTPPTFLWHTFEDQAVPVENSLLFASALTKQKIPFELHVYPKGGHGSSTGKEFVCDPVEPAHRYLQNWTEHARSWVLAQWQG